MRILSAGEWRDGYLDYYRGPDEYRIQVLAIKNLEELKGVYVLRPRSLRLVFNYLRHIGPRAVLRKIFSRLSEERRNQKYVSAGIGQILESPDEGRFQPGELVAFLAPVHPAAAERLVLNENFLTPAEFRASAEESFILYLPAGKNGEKWWRPAAAWSSFSGTPIAASAAALLQKNLLRDIQATNWSAAERLEAGTGEVKERTFTSRSHTAKTAVLFGYGNYAKTIVLPNLRPRLALAGVHEIDPTQIYPLRRGLSFDTAPIFRKGERADAALIAGFHHTHAGLAAEALRRGMYAIVEKPVATTREDMEVLAGTIAEHPGRFLAGFHKRYSPFNALIRRDLNVHHEHPLNYHAIAYEVAQPENYWYRWPNSKGPIVANGCHWIDHFLFLNHWSEPVKKDVFAAPDGSVNVSLLLKNGAFFSLTLTDRGSPRIGVQDHVEIRVPGGSVRIINDSKYSAERDLLTVRQMHINKMANYRLAYQSMAETIAAGGAGDSLASFKISTKAILDLEEIYAKTRRQGRE